MDHSEQQHLSFPAAQLIASTDNSQACAKNSKAPPPRLKTVSAFDMTKPGAWKERQSLYRSLCRTSAGRVPLEQAELYEDLLSIWQGKDTVKNLNKRDGCYYWGRTIADWAKKYKCTEHHFKWLLKGLRDAGLIATCVMKKPGNKLHIRPLVAEGSASLSGWPDASNYAYLLKAKPQAQQAPADEKCPNAGGQKVSECQSAESVLTKDLGLAVALAGKSSSVFVDASLSTEAPPVISSMLSGKINPDTGSKTSTPDAVVKTPKFCTASEKNAAGLLWLSLVTQYLPAHALPLEMRDWKIMRDLCTRIDAMTDLPGHEPVLRWVIQHWSLWAKSIGYADQVAPRKLTTVLDTALAEYRKERQRLVEKQAYKAEMEKSHADLVKQQAEKASTPPPSKKLSSIQAEVQKLVAEKAAQQTPAPAVEPLMDDEPAPQPTPDEIRAWWTTEIARQAAESAKPKTSISAGTSPKFKTKAHA